jgi:hypothetical protein
MAKAVHSAAALEIVDGKYVSILGMGERVE